VPSTASAPTLTRATGAPHERRPLAVGVAVEAVGLLANGARHRQAGDCHPLASPRSSPVADRSDSRELPARQNGKATRGRRDDPMR
jgi:hypothetical protein